MNEAFGILGTVLGVDWLNDAAEDFSPSAAIAFRRHPLGDIVSTAGDAQLAELLELAGFLRDLKDVPGLNKVMAALKGPYRSTHFQLRLAALLARAGAEIEQLEPPSEGGRNADIAFRFEGSAFAVECLRPSAGSSDSQDERIRLAHDVLGITKQYETVLSVAILLREEPTPAVRREIARVVRKLANEVAEESRTSDAFPAILASGPAGVVSVSRGLQVPAGSPPRWSAAPGFPIGPEVRPALFVRYSAARASEMTGIDAEYRTGSGLSHVALWLESDKEEFVPATIDLSPPLMRLARKLERKLAQARTSDGRLRILATESWLATEIHRADTATVDRLRGKLIESHDNVAGVLVLQHRNAVSDPRGRQIVAYIGPRERVGVPLSLLARIPGVELVRRATS